MPSSASALRFDVRAGAVRQIGILGVAPPAHELLREARLDDPAFTAGARLGVEGVGVEAEVGGRALELDRLDLVEREADALELASDRGLALAFVDVDDRAAGDVHVGLHEGRVLAGEHLRHVARKVFLADPRRAASVGQGSRAGV